MQIDRKIRLNNWYILVFTLFSILITFISFVFILERLGDILAIALLSTFSILGFAIILYLFVTFKSVRIKNSGLYISKKFYKWTDLKSVYYHPKRNSIISFEFQLDRGSVLFETNDNKKHTIVLSLYKDYYILKFIAIYFDQLKSNNGILINYLNNIDTKEKYSDLHNESFQIYNPNLFKIPYFGIIFFGFVFVVVVRNYTDIFLFIFLVLLIFLTGFNYHYFKLSDNYLIVKNLIYFWKQKVFRLDYVENVNYGKSGDRAIVSGLKINTKDLKQYFFASGLTKKSKILLLSRLNNKIGVK